MKKILIGVILIGVILVASYFIRRNIAIAPSVTTNTPVTTKPTPSGQTSTKPVELCFAKFGTPDKNGYYDAYTLRMDLNGENVKGELNLLPAEKDKKTGEIEGTVSAVDKTMMARTASLWWYASAEGMNVKEELKVIFGEGTANVGMGEMVDRGDGVYVYKDPKNISYSLSLTDVACADLAERGKVMDYLRENIAALSPVKAVLGGTWYVTSVVIDVDKNSGTVFYEDGHIQEKKSFSYTTKTNGDVSNLVIK